MKRKAYISILTGFIILSVTASAQISERDLAVTESILRFIFSEHDAKEAVEIAELKKKQREIEDGTYIAPSPKDPFFDGSFLDDIKSIEAKTYLPFALSIGGSDPPKSFVEGLSSKKHPVVSKEKFKQWPENDPDFRLQLATGELEPPILFSVRKIELLPSGVLLVDVARYCGPLHADFYKYKLKRKGEKWVVVDENHWGAA